MASTSAIAAHELAARTQWQKVVKVRKSFSHSHQLGLEGRQRTLDRYHIQASNFGRYHSAIATIGCLIVKWVL